MNNRVLEYKDISGYLPHDLYLEFAGMVVVKAVGWDKEFNTLKVERPGLHYAMSKSIDNFRPYLLPESTMYETITHNGEKIIPIVEMAKIASKGVLDMWGDSITEKRLEYSLSKYHAPSALIKVKVSPCDMYFFKFSNGSFNIYNISDGNIEKVVNQFQLFDYLHELKIDYRGLIDSKLAIDYRTLGFFSNKP